MPGSNDGQLGGGIDGGEAVHVARVIEDHGYVGALAGQAGACAARQHGGAGGAAGGQRGLDVGGVAGQDDADGKLAVVGGVGGVEGAGAEVEEDIAAQGGFEAGFQFAMGGEALMFQRRLVGQNGKGAHAGMVARRRAGKNDLNAHTKIAMKKIEFGVHLFSPRISIQQAHNMISDTRRAWSYKRPQVVGWFLVGGMLGLATCFAIVFAGNPPAPLLSVLWPAIAMFFDPSDNTSVGAAVFLFGSNFVVYGVAGVAVGMIFSVWQAWRESRAEKP